ncbi:N-acetylglucosaminyltransferase [Cadophora gregata]|uniref:N-acetylglucosaminyltransferase n=1 Tax=Cadophora gregata TaxID=51156 RepID=UPI0026DB6475|nr:N-acetylglucosaminyltransferase [Cadophora gregata]KAK0100800.1 N-acetylglucosaminyltransferase [Cadophora gregata]KAK0117205.1 N-acetylglucosaminyltransferase [Cadophora gregata f. sp. sojae]
MKRRSSQPPLLDLPDFLQDSPFLPSFDSRVDDDYKRHHQPRPTTRQILTSKPARTVLAVLLTILALIYLRNSLRSHHIWARLTGPSCYYTDPVTVPSSHSGVDVDWSKFAYTQYATNVDYLCNAVMIFETLHRLGSKADRLLLYPNKYSLDVTLGTVESRLLVKARDEFNVTLKAVRVQHQNLAAYSGPNWADSYTKLLAFSQKQYTRLLVLDSDATILQPLDSLFLLPSAPAIMPRAWWLPYPFLSSHFMLIEPSDREFWRVQKAMENARVGYYDMEIMNKLYGRTCRVLPHEKYALLTGELRAKDHAGWLSGGIGIGKGKKLGLDWDVERMKREARVVHFSDSPLPKPWLATEEQIEKFKPECVEGVGWEEDCREREIWVGFYEDFRRRRKDICAM